MGIRFAIVALVVAAFLEPSRASACSCESQSPRAALDAASVVFEGRVTSISPATATEEGAAALAVEFSVARGWKGVQHETLTIQTPSDTNACGFEFRLGESYLVYAVDHAGTAWVSQCSRTRMATDAVEDVRALGMGVTPVDTAAATDQDKKATHEPPARGGCAGCSVGATASAGTDAFASLASLIALAMLGLAARRHSRRRSARH